MRLDHEKIDEKASEIRKKLLDSVESYLKKKSWKNKTMNNLMSGCMENDDLRTQLFRFIDVFPTFKNHHDLVLHFLSFVWPFRNQFPWSLGKALVLADKPLAIHVAAFTIKRIVNVFANHFIVNSKSESEIEKLISSLRSFGYDTTMDVLGEDVLTEEEADNFKKQYLNLIKRLGAVKAPEGFSNNISIKLSSLIPKCAWDAINFDECVFKVSNSFEELLKKANEQSVVINVDMEHFAVRDLTLEIFKKTLAERRFSKLKEVGIVAQAYLVDAEESLDDLLNWIQKTANLPPITIRLVKGAYWDYEKIKAQEQRWPIPVIEDKEKTDNQFNCMAEKILMAQKNESRVRLACGSHNPNSIAYIMALTEYFGLDKKKNEMHLLYGMGDLLREAIKKEGFPTRIYVPCGDLIPSMAYLVRRLLENTSQQSFLGTNFVRPFQNKESLSNLSSFKPQSIQNTDRLLIPKEYQPEPHTDFSKACNRQAMQKAIKALNLSKKYNEKCPLIIGKNYLFNKDLILSRNPAEFNSKKIIGSVSKANIGQATLAIETANKAYPAWNNTPIEKRAKILLKIAEIIREKRFKLSALQILEVSKTWREADADVAEGIDFLEYYAKMAVHLMKERPTELLFGETNRYSYQGRGVSIVISPWNFPMAISIGMCAAALASGNTVIFKPASRAVVCGYEIAKIFIEAGVPKGVFNFIAGSGGELGKTLVKHPNVKNIIFTGSKETGFTLMKWAAEADFEQQTHIRRVIAEMGGKNAIIVDASADIDQAVFGVVSSAFGYQGQKCSASSRVIVLNSIYKEFVKRLTKTVASLKIGDPRNPGTDIAAVIDEKAFKKINEYIEIGKYEATLDYQVDTSNLTNEGYFVGPVIFTNVLPEITIAQEEIFGPVLSVIKAKNLDEAIKIGNTSQYRLTGGLYSRTDENINLVKKHFNVGNLYINRNISGAIVGRQPFGGFGASGTGPKAGGPDYLLQLMDARTITENTVRRGFSPELKN